MKIKKQLLEACERGERKAQYELYKECFSPLISICYRFANNKDDAAALLNEAFFRILTNIENRNPDVVFIAWARRITLNYCINQYRKDNTRKKYITNLEPDKLENEEGMISDGRDNGIYNAETLALVQEEIKNLSPTTQEVFQLFTLEGYSHKEIAGIMEITEGTSKWHVNNARTKLKEALKSTLKVLTSILL